MVLPTFVDAHMHPVDGVSVCLTALFEADSGTTIVGSFQ
jgi:predicted amidohydrolase YtcJ